jgi:uncharacterized protein (DUF433 family)
MFMLRLTKRVVASLPTRAGDYIQFDEELPGFGIRVMPSGRRYFLIQYRRNGQGINTESLYAVAAFRLLLLTGCRLREIQTLQWPFVHLEDGELRLPEGKTGAKTVHLGAAATAVLRVVPRLKDNPFVVAGKKAGTHLTDLQRPWRKVREAANLDDVRIHDLRHTFASGGLALGEGLPMIGKLLGHTQVQTTARYAHFAADPVKAAATKIAERLASALAPDPTAPPRADLIAEASSMSPAVALELATYWRALRMIMEDSQLNDGAPTFRGTRLMVAPIADLLRNGTTLLQLQQDFPRLTAEMANAALIFARAEAA